MIRYLKQSKMRLIGLSVALLVLLIVGGIVFADITGDWAIDFEDLDLGELNGQGSFSGENGYFSVVSDVVFDGIKGGKGLTTAPTIKTITFDPDDCKVGDINEDYFLHIYPGLDDAGQGFYIQFFEALGTATVLGFDRFGGEDGYRLVMSGPINRVDCDTGDWLSSHSTLILINPGILPYSEWTEIKLIINENNSFRVGWSAPGVNYDESEWCFWFSNTEIDVFLDSIVYHTKGTFYFDEFYGFYPPPGPEIQGYSPESGTEITDLDQSITIKYFNFDWEIYSGFVVNFRDLKIGATSNSRLFLADNLDPTGTGQVQINLQDFGFDSNGKWYLTGLGFGTHLDIEGGMFLTTRGYIDFYTDELVEITYFLLLNVETLPDPYTFTGGDEWYTTNVERFDEPTTLFTSFVDIFTPIFEKTGEFGMRVQNMFDEDEAYDRGYAMGEIFPLISGYTQKIDQFFGGFPLVSFFKYLILVMLAIFVVRAIMKFIPFFGG